MTEETTPTPAPAPVPAPPTPVVSVWRDRVRTAATWLLTGRRVYGTIATGLALILLPEQHAKLERQAKAPAAD